MNTPYNDPPKIKVIGDAENETSKSFVVAQTEAVIRTTSTSQTTQEAPKDGVITIPANSKALHTLTTTFEFDAVNRSYSVEVLNNGVVVHTAKGFQNASAYQQISFSFVKSYTSQTFLNNYQVKFVNRLTGDAGTDGDLGVFDAIYNSIDYVITIFPTE